MGGRGCILLACSVSIAAADLHALELLQQARGAEMDCQNSFHGANLLHLLVYAPTNHDPTGLYLT